MAAVPPLNRRRRALLSVTDKTGLADLATALQSFDYELIASGGTASHLRESGFSVQEVSELTAFPEIFGGRVKTLHPVIYGGILGATEDDFAAIAELGVQPLDVVCVNLYRFEAAVQAGRPEADLIEQIDIGGPALLRAAAKNFGRVTVLPDPEFYAEFRLELSQHDGGTDLAFRRRMAHQTFQRVTAYNQAIAVYFGREAAGTDAPAPAGQSLRYGENPHQAARLLITAENGKSDLTSCGLEQVGGVELSYNNLVDLIATLKLACDFERSCCAVIKHTNPCGFGLGEPAAALERALRCDPESAFGGVFAFTTPVDLAAAGILRQRFLEIIAAPVFAAEALALLRKKKKVRLLTFDRDQFVEATRGQARSFGRLTLSQDEDEGFPELQEWRVVAGPKPPAQLSEALTMAWKVCKHVKSNAIVIGNGEGTLGIGAGQMSRVDSVRIAIRKASDQQLDLEGSVAASDGFFPFPDSIERLADVGVVAVISPGGSIRDEEVASAASERGLTLIFTGKRHFRH